MTKVAWKTISGYGPYAYLQESVWLGGGKVTSKHIAYLGKLGGLAGGGAGGSLFPGHHISWEGSRINVPSVDPDIKADLKPSALIKVVAIEEQLEKGVPIKQIITPKISKAKAFAVTKTKKAAPAPSVTVMAPIKAAVAEPITLAPKFLKATITSVPKDNKGKPLIKDFHIKKMEELAAKGDWDGLQAFAAELSDKMLASSKKAAIANALEELKGQMTGAPTMESADESDQDEIITAVAAGKQSLPKQSVPTPTVIQNQIERQALGTKNWDTDLEQVAGKKGSNEGGLFKDKKLQTLHYVKWPTNEDQARIEVLANRLYQKAGVPMPNAQLITVKGKQAVLSDWIDDVSPMTPLQMMAHKDVRRNFVVDAWLANWDVVGMGSDNIVKGPGDVAYRIDTGGTMMFRAQGKSKAFSEDDVAELQSMRNPSTAPQAAKVFSSLTDAELKAGAEAVVGVSDQQIDEAVDMVVSQTGGPSSTLSRIGLKRALKKRRDFIRDNVLHIKKPKPVTITQLGKLGKLNQKSVKLLQERYAQLLPSTHVNTLRTNTAKSIMTSQLKSAKAAEKPSAAVRSNYKEWKGSAAGSGGSLIRWAAAVVDEGAKAGDKEIKELERFFTFKHGGSPSMVGATFQEKLKTEGQDLVNALAVTRDANAVLLALQHGGQDEITLYRTWQPDQVKFYGWGSAKVGDTLEMPAEVFSHSLNPKVFAHGGLRTKLKVPVKKLVLSDRLNNVGGAYVGEDEVLYRMPLKMEVIHT